MSERINGVVTPRATVRGEVARAENIGGTRNYNDLNNKPSINTIELVSDRSFRDLGLIPLNNQQIDNIFNEVTGG